MVKESKGQLGMLATRRALYRATTEEGFDMVAHISRLRQLQEELHIFGSLVSDEAPTFWPYLDLRTATA
jgi:hypothetical protein